MTVYSVRTSILAAAIGALLLADESIAADAEKAIIPYYFPGEEKCTLMIDFRPSMLEVGQLKGRAKVLHLAKTMLREYARAGLTQCGPAKHVRMAAVSIEGVDNYGRPDFANRINLLNIEATPDVLADLIADVDRLTFARLRRDAHVKRMTGSESKS